MQNRQEILLREYGVCNQDSNSMAHTYWVATTAFASVNTGILGWIAKTGISDTMGGRLLPTLLNNTVITVVGLAIIAITVFLWLWLKRTNWLIKINNHRMSEIERLLHELNLDLGIQKNSLVEHLNNDSEWDKLPNEDKGRLSKLYRERPCLGGYKCVKSIYITLISIWAFLIASSWFIPCIRAIFSRS
jgi:hypothetical protein